MPWPVRVAACALLILTACGATAAQPQRTARPNEVQVVEPEGKPDLWTYSPGDMATVSVAGPWTFSVASTSKTTIRVREVLAQVRLPGDATLVATGMKGSFVLNADGTFADGSKVTTDLTTLRSDQSQRDQFIKDNTLQTRRFPSAEFAPTKTSGLTMPLALAGDLSFTITGNMTAHGVTKEVTFAVKARRD